jgi:hypothetical protein
MNYTRSNDGWLALHRPSANWLAVALTGLALLSGVGAEPARAQVEGEGGEEATFRFVDPASRFSFEYPQSWGNSTQPGEDIRFTGADEFISVTIVDTALGPLEFGDSDDVALAATLDSYQSRPLRTYNTSTVVREYSWQAGPSPVTGKMVPSMAKRFYLLGPDGKLAIFTYSSPVRAYDPEGADDFATAFRWLT